MLAQKQPNLIEVKVTEFGLHMCIYFLFTTLYNLQTLSLVLNLSTALNNVRKYVSFAENKLNSY